MDAHTKVFSPTAPAGEGVVGFWQWIALQTYLDLNLKSSSIPFQEWLAFCAQTARTGAPGLPRA